MSPTIFLLIALLKTPGEGGTIVLPYPDEAACIEAGERLEAQFEGVEHTLPPTVLYTCFEAPAQN